MNYLSSSRIMKAEGVRFAPILALHGPMSAPMTTNARVASPMRTLPERASTASAHCGSRLQCAVIGNQCSQQALHPPVLPAILADASAGMRVSRSASTIAETVASMDARRAVLQGYQDNQEVPVAFNSAWMRSMQEAHTTQTRLLEERMEQKFDKALETITMVSTQAGERFLHSDAAIGELKMLVQELQQQHQYNFHDQEGPLMQLQMQVADARSEASLVRSQQQQQHATQLQQVEAHVLQLLQNSKGHHQSESHMLGGERALSSSNMHDNVLELHHKYDEMSHTLESLVRQTVEKNAGLPLDHLETMAEVEKMAAAMERTTTFVQEMCGSFEQKLVVLETELHETCDRFQQQMVEIEMLFRALEHGQTAQPTHMPDSQQIVSQDGLTFHCLDASGLKNLNWGPTGKSDSCCIRFGRRMGLS